MATIYVGGFSQVEMKERCDRFEDAIMATKCAMIGGVLPGGGLALCKLSMDNDFAPENLEDKLVKILKTPYRKIFSRELEAQAKVVEVGVKDGKSYQIVRYQPLPFWNEIASKDFFKEGIIDPFLVVKATLENAISVASTILTTKCIILNV